MGDGSSGFGSGFSEVVKDIGGKVRGTVKSSAQTLGATVITQVTGQTPKPKSPTGSQVGSIPATPTEQKPNGSTFDLGSVFTGEKNPQATTPQSQCQNLTQDQLDQTAKANSAKDSAKISQLLQELHKQVYYDPLVRKIEGRDQKQEKSVQEEHEEDDNKKQMAELEQQKKEEKTQLPPNFREFGRGKKG